MSGYTSMARHRSRTSRSEGQRGRCERYSDSSGNPGTWAAHTLRPILITLLLMVAVATEAQSVKTGSTAEVGGDAGEVSEYVDEREDSYRKSMELQDAGFRQRPRANTTYTSRGSQEKIDQLPLPSQENIKDQLRDMIIERGQWAPGEDLSDYPYEPSAAARSHAGLARQEREAWAEQVGKYQQREAAAHAGQPAGAAGAEGAQAGQSRNAQGGAASAASSAQNVVDAQRSAAADARSADAADVEVPVAGVAESALGFLQGRGSAAGTGPGELLANGAAQASAASPAGPGAQTLDHQAQTDAAGDGPEAAAVTGAPGAAENTPDSPAQAAQAQAELAEAERAAGLAGSLALDELGRLQGLAGPATGDNLSAAGMNGAAGSRSPAPGADSAIDSPATGAEESATVGAAEPDAPANNAAPAGTLALNDLRHLDHSTPSGQKTVNATDDRAEPPAEPVRQAAPALTPTATADTSVMSNPATPPSSARTESAPIDAAPVEPGTLELAELGRVRGVAEQLAEPAEPAPPPDQPTR